MTCLHAGDRAPVPHPSRCLRGLGSIHLLSPLLFLSLLLSLSIPASAQSLYAQSLQTALTRANPYLEFLLFDLRTGDTLVDTFADPSHPIPTGSLLKPFLAYAYAQSHSGNTPTFTCRGLSDRCWNPAGHGRLALSEAIAQSCNAYFLSLARNLTPAGLAAIRFVPPPPQRASPEDLIGITAAWPIAPATLAEAYAGLLASPASSYKDEILTGMHASADHGTAAPIGRHHGGILAKTGTAPCIDSACKASGDGLIVAIVPASNPKLLLLLRKRATTGAVAAAWAGRILTQLETLHAY